MKANEHGSFGVFVGIDWADAKHDVCLQAAGTAVRIYEQFSHRPADIDEWVASVRRRFPGTIAIALELSKGPIVSALQRHDDLVIYPINPSTLAKYLSIEALFAVGAQHPWHQPFLRVVLGGLSNHAFVVAELLIEQERIVPAERGAVGSHGHSQSC